MKRLNVKGGDDSSLSLAPTTPTSRTHGMIKMTMTMVSIILLLLFKASSRGRAVHYLADDKSSFTLLVLVEVRGYSKSLSHSVFYSCWHWYVCKKST